MQPLTNEQQKKLLRLAKVVDNGDIALLEEIQGLEDKIEALETIVPALREARDGEVGPKGERGEKGESIKGEKGDKGDAGRDGKDGKNGKDGRDGINGKDGIDGKDGADGFVDTATIAYLEDEIKRVESIKQNNMRDGIGLVVRELRAGTGVTIDNSNQEYPIVNATGGEGGTPSNTVVAETAYGLSPAAGTATEYARADHTHGSQNNPVAGVNTSIQFNDGGVFGGDSKLSWDKASSVLKIGEGVSILPNNPLAIQANVDTYVQVNIKNDSDGTNASADYIVTADNGDDTTNYGDFGINSSAYNSIDYPIWTPNDVYLYSSDHHLVLGSGGVGKKIKFHTDGFDTANISAEIDADGMNLPTGKTYRINGVDIVPAGGAGSMVSIEQGDVALVDNSSSAMVLDLNADDFVAGVVGNEVNLSLTKSVATHVGESDPHTQYQKESEKGQANGYASLGADGLVPSSQLPASSGGLTKDVIGVTVDGGGSVVTTGSKGYKVIQEACTITGWTILGKEVGSVVIDIKKSTYAGFPTTSSIAGTEKPTLASAQKNQDLSLSTWTTSLAEGDILEFNVDSASGCTRFNLFIHITK